MLGLLDRSTQLTDLKGMPGFSCSTATTGFAELVSIGPGAPAALLTSIVTNGATAFLIIMAMTFG
jgi:hypothetical protein